MRVLIEEYQYEVADVLETLDGLFTLQDVEQKIAVSYVGYYFNPKIHDVVYVLPKVLIDQDGKVFGQYEPKDVIHLDKASLTPIQRKFIYEFAVWVHRAIVVYNESHKDNDIVLKYEIERLGNSGQRKNSETLLDVILELIRFNKENQQFFTFILKNIHSGFNKINWQKTISNSRAVIEDETPVYLRPVNKKRQVNFDEELIIIYFSILQYVGRTYGFPSKIDFGFQLLTESQFQRYLDGYGRIRLHQIKYKYFSDTALKLWNLCAAFFDVEEKIKVNSTKSEYLLAKSFHIVFEAMIDELVGVPHDQIPKGLQEQDDGKVVDHFYTYQGLLVNDKPDDDIYYIGDSKYYKIGNNLGTESTYKQRTYARNVIQWNLNIHAQKNEDELEPPFEDIKLFDDVTEGYNIIPNFFISANIDKDTLDYLDRTVEHDPQPKPSWHFKNRLYDRDTLLLSHYDVNFLYVLSLYARNNSGEKAAWKATVRQKFREAIQRMLNERYDFFAMRALPAVDGPRYIKENFQMVLGKMYAPYTEGVYSLALETPDLSKCKTDKERATAQKIIEDNAALLKELRRSFDVEKLDYLGQEPAEKLPERVMPAGPVGVAEELILISGYNDEKHLHTIESAKLYYVRMGDKRGAIKLVSGFEKCRWLLLHSGKELHLYEIKPQFPVPYSSGDLRKKGFEPSSEDVYLTFELKNGKPLPLDGLNINPDNIKRIRATFAPYFTPLAALQQEPEQRDKV